MPRCQRKLAAGRQQGFQAFDLALLRAALFDESPVISRHSVHLGGVIVAERRDLARQSLDQRVQ